MTKIIITRKELLYQVIDIETLPEMIILEGMAFIDDKRLSEFEHELPQARRVFTSTQYAIFRELWNSRGKKVSHRSLCSAIESGRDEEHWSGALNTLSVHIKNIRIRIKKHSLPFEIVNRRPYRSLGESGGYMLKD